jgi:hypothetical protein
VDYNHRLRTLRSEQSFQQDNEISGSTEGENLYSDQQYPNIRIPNKSSGTVSVFK